MPTRREREQQREITELRRRLESVERDPAATREVALLEAKVAERDASIEKLGAKLAASEKKSAERQERARGLQVEVKLLKEQVRQNERDLKRERERAKFAEERTEQVDAIRKSLAAKLHDANDEIKAMEREVSRLLDVVAHLQAQIARSPENSSVPPSASPSKKRIPNSRVKSGKRPGAQMRHQGHGRKRLEPDVRVNVPALASCPHCGGELDEAGGTRTHQVTDVIITTKTTEYVSHGRVCKECGKASFDPFPACAPNEANYGASVKSLIAYLVGGCNVSGENARNLLRELTEGKVDVSGGSVCNFMRQLSRAAQEDIERIGNDVAASGLIGSDATFTRSEGHQTYVYVYHNAKDSVLYKAEQKKGHAALAGSPVEAAADATIIHDHDTTYYSYGARHAECNAHVLRYLRGVTENEPGQDWAADISSLLTNANHEAKAARAKGAASIAKAYVSKAKREYERILADAVESYRHAGVEKMGKLKPEGYTLARRMLKFADNHLLFMCDLGVPFENNMSERLLRGAKKKIKQSGGFRSTKNGEQPYCDFLTITETAKLRGQSPFAAVKMIFEA